MNSVEHNGKFLLHVSFILNYFGFIMICYYYEQQKFGLRDVKKIMTM